MWDGVFWSILGTVVFGAVALLFIVDALRERTAGATIASLLAIAAGFAKGADFGPGWLPLSVLLAAIALYWISERREPRPGTPLRS